MKPITTNMEQASRPAPDTDSRQLAKMKLAGRMGPSMCLKSSGNTETADDIAVDFSECSVRHMQALNPVPELLDPFTEALLGGVDPMAAHQALTLTFPMLAFLGSNMRVLYADGKLRWVCGQSWQMGGSGCGKSLVLRSLEDLFLSKELADKNASAMKAADYSLLSEKEQKDTSTPREVVRILDSIPTAIALLKQMQINGGGAIYLSCSECGEFGKKIQARYYSLVLDMMKKSYDGTGEAYLYQASDKIYYVPSMKICCNIGGTIDPMYKIFRQCDSDGTLSRGSVTILGERKDEETEGAYKAPSWTKEQVNILIEGANRLRNFNNTYNENQNENESYDEESDKRVYDGAKGGDCSAPTVEEYNISVQEERVRRALSVPAIVAFGKEIKRELARIGEITDDCCSRANEIAQGICYLLYIANGLADVPESERDSNYQETLHRIMDVSRWWVNRSIDCALAIQTRLNANSKSQREEIRAAYKQTMGAYAENALKIRNRAFEEFEAAYAGKVVNTVFVKDNIGVLGKMSLRNIKRLVDERGWPEAFHGKYIVTKKEENDGGEKKQ